MNLLLEIGAKKFPIGCLAGALEYLGERDRRSAEERFAGANP